MRRVLDDVLDELDAATVGRLLETFARIPPDELARAATGLSRMSPTLLRRVVALLTNPQVARLIR